MTGEKIAQQCPMPGAHRRLMDCHVQWHRLHEDYFDPHGFRIMLNALVPNLRNVTWLLQKQKKDLAGFDQWYPRFQQQSGNSEIMRWVVKSRNRITKEADLELHSEPEPVKSDETRQAACSSWGFSFGGSLIQAALGRRGGIGGCRNRPGLVA